MGKGRPDKHAHSKRRKEQTKRLSSTEEAAFKEQLRAQGLRIKQIDSDGNCLFRAIADQLDGSPERHAWVRTQVVNELERRKDFFQPFFDDDEDFGQHCSSMRRDGEWGDQHELLAASWHFNVQIDVHQPGQPRWQIRAPDVGSSAATIHLSYHRQEHYASVRLSDDGDTGKPKPIRIDSGGSDPATSDRDRLRHHCTAVEWALMEGSNVYDIDIVQATLGDYSGDEDCALAALCDLAETGEFSAKPPPKAKSYETNRHGNTKAKVSSASTNKSRSNVSNKKRQQEKAAGKRHGRPSKDCESESPLEADLDPLTKTFGALTV